jgi:hypothetical protein
MGKKVQKPPGYLCRRYNEGRCDAKDDRHPASWDPNYVLKHACSKYLEDKRKFCMEAHPESEHK